MVLVIFVEYGGGECTDLARKYQLICNPETTEVLQKSIAVMFRCSSMKCLKQLCTSGSALSGIPFVKPDKSFENV